MAVNIMKHLSIRYVVLPVFVMLLTLAVSCDNSNNNIFGCPAEMVKAGKSVTLEGEVVSFDGLPVMQISNLCAVDSFLVLTANVKESADKMFVLDMRGRKFKGSFIANGRGPGELLNPMCCGTFRSQSGRNPMYIFDLSLCESYAFDVEASVNAGQTELSKICRLPDGTLYAYPYRDSLHFVKVPDSECLGGMVLHSDGSVARKVALYEDVPGFMYFDRLSSADAFFSGTDMMAMAMAMLPQVNFIDVNTGEKHTVAIDRQYREWKQLLYDEMYTPTICYMAAIPAGSVVVALYHGVPLADWAAGDAPAHLHIFDADGGFLYDISLAESLKVITYDRNSGMLYGVDMEDRIYQYDMSGII